MHYYTDPYYSTNYRLKPWFALSEEERTYIVYNSYNKRILQSDEVKDYLKIARINTAANLTYPFAAYLVFNRTLFKYFSNYFYFGTSKAASNVTKLGVVGLTWLLFINHSPFYKNFIDKREEKLNLLLDRLGGGRMMAFGDLLPRWTTVTDINRKFQTVYNERNSLFVGYLYPHEERAEPLVDFETLPKPKAGKISK